MPIIRSKYSYVVTDEVWTEKGFVYLMGNGRGPIKIGYSGEPKKRLYVVRSKQKDKSIQLIYTFPADEAPEAERILHQIYANRKVGDEWFDLSGDDIATIKSITKYENGRFI